MDSAFIKENDFYSDPLSNLIVDAIAFEISKQINKHYDTKIKNFSVTSETYDEGVEEIHRADNSVYSNGNWYRNKDIDFTTIIFLKDFNTKPPLDPNTEIFGGNLEFPTFNFTFNPEAGTAVTYPAYPNFLNVFTPPKIGTNHILRISYESDTMFVYDHSKFHGKPNDWFNI